MGTGPSTHGDGYGDPVTFPLVILPAWHLWCQVVEDISNTNWNITYLRQPWLHCANGRLLAWMISRCVPSYCVESLQSHVGTERCCLWLIVRLRRRPKDNTSFFFLVLLCVSTIPPDRSVKKFRCYEYFIECLLKCPGLSKELQPSQQVRHLLLLVQN